MYANGVPSRQGPEPGLRPLRDRRFLRRLTAARAPPPGYTWVGFTSRDGRSRSRNSEDRRRVVRTLLAAMLTVTLATAQENHKDPRFERLKALAGEWSLKD